MKKLIIPGIALLLVGVVAAFAIRASRPNRTTNDQTPEAKSAAKNETPATSWPDKTARYITAVPVDLTQIERISKYRSCAGHDRSGYSFDLVLETDRSMKHYLLPVPALQGTLDRVKLFAPFDGTVTSIFLEKDKIGGRPKNGNGIVLSTPVDPGVRFGFGHLYFTADFTVSDRVTAGQLIGYAALGDPGFDFDIDLMGAKKVFGSGAETEILGSAFDHMTDAVLAEFAARGITPTAMSWTKEYRDAHPCHYDQPALMDPKLRDRENEDWVALTPPAAATTTPTTNAQTNANPEPTPTTTGLTLELGSVTTPYVHEADISSVNEAYGLAEHNPFWGFRHPGIDFMTTKDLVPVQAAIGGTVQGVVTSKESGPMGWHTGFCINRGDSGVCYNLETFSSDDAVGDRQRANVLIHDGQTVKQGEVIANLVHGGDGTHIDFGITVPGNRVCPEPYFTTTAKASVLRLIHKDHPTWPMCTD